VLTAGDEVRLGGERVGQVQSVALAPGGSAQATLSLGGRRLGAGATARIRPRGLAGAVYVDLSAGAAGRPLRSGSLIPATGGVQLTDVISGFDASARQALARALNGYGAGLAGRGQTLNRTIATMPSLLANTAATLRAVTPAPGALGGAIGNAGGVAGALAPVGSDTLSRLVDAGAAVLGTTGSRAAEVRRTIQATPGVEAAAAEVLPPADRLLARLSATARDLEPGVAALGRALPSLQRIETAGGAIPRLGSVAGAASPALRAVAPALITLRGPAAGLTPLTTPLWTLAEVLIPYRTELLQAPLGFTRWGDFRYDFGTGAGHRAVRFTMVLSCALARDPYPAPGAAAKERRPCP
jgi:ABC-type transporter Mla subunit MlaD